MADSQFDRRTLLVRGGLLVGSAALGAGAYAGARELAAGNGEPAASRRPSGMAASSSSISAT